MPRSWRIFKRNQPNQFSNPLTVCFFHRWVTAYRDHVKVSGRRTSWWFLMKHISFGENKLLTTKKKRSERKQKQHNTGRKELHDCLKHALFSLLSTDTWTQVTQILLEKVYTLFFLFSLSPMCYRCCSWLFLSFHQTYGDPYLVPLPPPRFLIYISSQMHAISERCSEFTYFSFLCFLLCVFCIRVKGLCFSNENFQMGKKKYRKINNIEIICAVYLWMIYEIYEKYYIIWMCVSVKRSF